MKKTTLTFCAFVLSVGTVFSQLIISEIMYNPASGTTLDAQDYEFIEVTNISNTTINVAGFTFSQGIYYTFPINSTIGANQRVVLVRNQAAFSERYPGVSSFGVYTGGLKNSGETITLVDLSQSTVTEVTYNDASPWPVLADGQGFSLTPIDEASSVSPSSPEYWTTSSAINGSPGKKEIMNTDFYEVYVNELLTAPADGDYDKVELYNDSKDTINIGNWYLTDNRKTPKRYKFPANTKIAPKGYLVIDETVFNFLTLGFSFSKSGDEVFIFAANSSNQLTGYSHGFSFMAQLENVSFGRTITSDGREHFVRQTEQTFGSANAKPLVGPIVIEKIMYNPDSFTDEFLVLTNISDERVELATTELVDSNVYRLDGVTFKFPQPSSTFLEAGQSLILSSLDAAEFRSKYNIDIATQVFQYVGALNNSGEKISIETPIYRDILLDNSVDNHYLVIDEVSYLPSAPWPNASASSQKYLQRINLSEFGSEPQNWFASDQQIISGLLNSFSSTKLVNFAYPTLVQNQLHIDNSELVTLSLIDATGHVQMHLNTISESIDVSSLAPGLYILNGTTAKNELLSMKVIKQ